MKPMRGNSSPHDAPPFSESKTLVEFAYHSRSTNNSRCPRSRVEALAYKAKSQAPPKFKHRKNNSSREIPGPVFKVIPEALDRIKFRTISWMRQEARMLRACAGRWSDAQWHQHGMKKVLRIVAVGITLVMKGLVLRSCPEPKTR
jgi:hypothetical protein